jgi:hypothetical protein
MLQFAPLADTALVVALAVVALGLLAFGAWVVYLEHRTRVALVEAGEYRAADGRAWVLGGGLLALAVGVGQAVEAWAATGVVGDGPTLALVGVAALVYYLVRRREDRTVALAPER